MSTTFVSIPGAGYGPCYSSTSVAIGTGSKTFTVQSGFAFVAGSQVLVDNASGQMYGTISSYSGTTMVISVNYVNGSGTYSSWSISLSPSPIGIFLDGGGQVFNVKYYGATGNGTTDDTTAIQAAITACIAAGGGQVFFPAGRYKISSTLTNTGSNVRLAGASRVATIAPTFTSGDVIYLYNSGGVQSRNSIEHLSISGASSGTLNAVHINQQNACTVDFCAIGTVDNGIVVDGASTYGVKIRDNIIGSPFTGDGIQVNNCGDLEISGNNIDGTFGAQPTSGIHLYSVGGGWIHDNDITLCTQGIMATPGTGQSVSYVKSARNYHDTCADYGGYFAASGSGTVIGWEAVEDTFETCGIHGCLVGGGVNGISFTASEAFNNVNNGFHFTGATYFELVNCKGYGNGAQRAGTVTTVGTTATLATGTGFEDYYAGHTITVNGSPYTIATVPDSLHFTTTTSMGTNSSPVAYTIFTNANGSGTEVVGGSLHFKFIGGNYGEYAGYPAVQFTGILMDSGASDYYNIIGADCSGNANAGIQDGGSGSHKNLAYNFT